MKRRILLLLLVMSICITTIQPKQAQVGEVVVAGVIGQALFEIIVGIAVSYELMDKVTAEKIDFSMYNISFGSSNPDYVLTEADIKAIEQNDLSQEMKMDVLYQGQETLVQYSNGEMYKGTRIDGKLYYLNPLLVDALSKSGQWVKMKQLDQSLALMGATSVYNISWRLKQDVTEQQVKEKESFISIFQTIGKSIQGLKQDNIPQEGYNQEQINAIQSNTYIQKLRYPNVTANIKAIYDTYPYYCIFVNKYGEYSAIFSQYEFVVNPVNSYRAQVNYNQSTTTKMITTYNTKAELFNGNYAFDVCNNTVTYETPFVRYTNSQTLAPYCYPYYGTNEFPYPFNNTDTQPLQVLTPEQVGVLDLIAKGIVATTATNILDLPENEVKDVFGQEVEGEYDHAQDVVAPGPVDAEKEYSDGVLGWLQRLWDTITGLPQALWDFIKGILNLIYQAIKDVITAVKAVADAIIGIFVVDWDVVGTACSDLADVWENKFGAVISIANQFTNLSAGNLSDTPPTITFPTPDILKPYMKSDTMTIVDLNDFADSFSIARGIISAFLWVSFGYYVINNFVPKFNIN